MDLPFEYGRYRRVRPLLFQGLSGAILDAGVGTGRNTRFYPRDSHVVGVDLSATMLQRAMRRRRLSPVSVELALMDIGRLAFLDGAFDAAVASFVFCTVPDALQAPALRELARVVKSGGSIRLLEYTRPDGRLRRLSTRLWAPWARWAFGASLDPRIDDRVEEAGLTVLSQRFVIGDQVRLIELSSSRPGGS
ncbi:MAG: class I SAM-dependent methyltransferase [Pseudomonadota bacterium]|nr:class I SAM-dependent methyltransferase [Pseudomonadota bacterium]